jgi:hypothetical protein
METARAAIKREPSTSSPIANSIAANDINYAMEEYVDSLLRDAVYSLESELDRKIEAQDPVEGTVGHSIRMCFPAASLHPTDAGSSR